MKENINCEKAQINWITFSEKNKQGIKKNKRIELIKRNIEWDVFVWRLNKIHKKNEESKSVVY